MKFRSLTVRLAFSVGVIVTVLTACLVLYFVHDSFKAATLSGGMRLQQLAVQSVDHLDFLAQSAGNNMRSFATYDTVARSFTYAVYRDQADKTLTRLLNDYKLYTYLFAFDPAGKILFGVTRSGNSLRGIDVSDRSYYKDILAGKTFAMSDVIKPKDDKGGQVVVMAVPVTGADGKLQGGMCVGFDWSEYSARYLDTVRLGQTGYLFMLNSQGAVISHALNKDLVFKDVSSFGFVQQILKGETGSLEYDWQGEAKLLGYAKVGLPGWYVCMNVTKSELLAETIVQRNILVGFGLLLILVLSTSVTLVMRRLILRPVQGIQQFTHDIAAGNFSAQFVSHYRYELGRLQDDISTMVGVLRDKLALAQGILSGLGQPCLVVDQDMRILYCNQQFLDFSRCPETLEEARGKTASEIFYGDAGRPFLLDEVLTCRCHVSRQVELVNRNGTERLSQFDAAPMYDLDGNLFGAFALFGNLTELGRQQKLIEQKNLVISASADQAGEVASNLASATDVLTVQIEESHVGAEDQTRMIAEMSSALELMQASITDVAVKAGSAVELAEQARDQALKGKGSVEDVVQMIEEVNGLAQDMKAGMAELGDKADGIGRIIDVISDIADQTNLLALNAAIEAARAGDAGRGFAVVADEVRKLAEKTMAATRDVGDAISVIQGSVRSTIAVTENTAQRIATGAERANESGAVLETIVATVSESAENVRSIAAATGEQSSASEEVLATAEQVRTIASVTVGAMRNSAQAVAELSSQAAQLTGIIASMHDQ